MRVLHLVECLGATRGRDPTSDVDVLACRGAVLGLPHITHDVWLLADAAGERRARDLGLRTPDRITPPLGHASLAWRSLRRLRQARRAPTVVQVWSRPCLSVVRRTFAAQPVLPPPADPTLRPPVKAADRLALRRALALNDRDLAVLLMADPPGDARAAQFSFLVGLLDFAGHHVAGVVPSGASGLARARAFYRRAVLECPIRFSRLPAAALVAACDVGILDAPPIDRSAPGQIARRRALARSAAALGLPVIIPAGCGIDASHIPGGLVSHGTKPADYAKAVTEHLTRSAGADGSGTTRPHAAAPAHTEDALLALEHSWRYATPPRAEVAAP